MISDEPWDVIWVGKQERIMGVGGEEFNHENQFWLIKSDLMGRKFQPGMMKKFWSWIVTTVVQQCECT